MKTLLELAEGYYAANAVACDGLVDELKAAGLDENALDETVHEGADNDDRDSDEASSVNNQGMAMQVASILEGNGAEEGSRIVRGVIPGPRP